MAGGIRRARVNGVGGVNHLGARCVHRFDRDLLDQVDVDQHAGVAESNDAGGPQYFRTSRHCHGKSTLGH